MVKFSDACEKARSLAFAPFPEAGRTAFAGRHDFVMSVVSQLTGRRADAIAPNMSETAGAP
jgi:hypothetical protein